MDLTTNAGRDHAQRQVLTNNPFAALPVLVRTLKPSCLARPSAHTRPLSGRFVPESDSGEASAQLGAYSRGL
jgi:hypothetical protein